MSKTTIGVTAKQLRELHLRACGNKTIGAWCAVAMDWADAANAEIVRLQGIVDKLRAAELSQTGWECGEDIVLLNGSPVGGTITKHRREFDRWWPAVKRELLGDAAEAAKEQD